MDGPAPLRPGSPSRPHLGSGGPAIHRPPIYNPVVRGAKRVIDLGFGVLALALQVPTYPERTRTAGGITGLAQVHDLRGDTSIEDRARFDNLYIDQYSLFLDVVIALQTIGSLFRSKQSY